MQAKRLFILLFFAFLLIVLGSSFFWHQLAAERPIVEKSLASYDNLVFQDQDACFSLHYNTFNIAKKGVGSTIEGKTDRLIVAANEKILFDEQIVLKESETIRRCILQTDLEEGPNLIEIFFGSEHLFFNVNKSDSAQQQESDSEIRLVESEGNKLAIEVKNNSAKGGVYPLNIEVNGEVQKEILVEIEPSESKEVETQLELESGENEIRLEFLGSELNENVNYEKKEGIFPIIGLFAFVLVFGFILIFFLLKYNFFDAVVYGFASFFSSLIAIPWILNLAGIRLDFYSIFTVLVIFCFVVYLFLSKKESAKETEDKTEIKKFLFYFLIFGLIAASIHLFIPSHFNNWNVFYERYAELVVENSSIPLEDPLGYLGRGFTFVWGYFLFNSSLAFLTGFSGATLFALIYFLLACFFFISIVYFAKSLNFKMDRTVVYFLLILSSLFIFTTFVNSPKHILSFSLLFLTVAMMLRKENSLLTGALVGFAAFTQISFLFLFPLAYVIISRNINWRALILSFIASVLIFSIMFMPIFLNFGSGHEIYSKEWGYLIRHFPFDFALDLGQVISLLFAAVAIKIILEWKQHDFYTKKLLFASIFLFLFEIFVSYRINIITHLVLVLLLFAIFKKQFENRYFTIMVVLFAIFSIMANIVIVFYSNVSPYVANSMEFIDSKTGSNEIIISDPFYAHIESYMGKRKVLADLYVEYADREKLDDVYDFILNGNKQILEKYNAGYVFVDREKIFTSATELYYFRQEKEFPFMDKIYINDFYSIHRTRRVSNT